MNTVEVEVKPAELGVSNSEKEELLNELAKNIRYRLRRSAEDIYEIGCYLVSAKEILKEEGAFVQWLQKEEFEICKSLAYSFMNVALTFKKYLSKNTIPNFGNLKIAASALYQLAQPVNASVFEEAISGAIAGETITASKARELISKGGGRCTGAATKKTTGAGKPKTYKHGFAVGDEVRVLKGTHKGKRITVKAVSSKVVTTDLGDFKPSHLGKNYLKVMESKGIVSGAQVLIQDSLKMVVCTFEDGRVLVRGGDYFHFQGATSAL